MRVHAQIFLFALLGTMSYAARAQSSDSIRDISQVWRTITASYLYSVPEEDLRKAAIQGLLAMDPHASYMDDAEYNQLTKGTATTFGGIGAELVKKDGKLLVVSAMEGSPAAAAGLRPHDMITKINDENAASKGLADAIKMIRGPIGSEIRLAIQRGAESNRAGNRVRLLLLPRIVRAARVRGGVDHGELQPRNGVDGLRHGGSPVF